jgi:RimJ/RimL family protein N-acetyltransferase
MMDDRSQGVDHGPIWNIVGDRVALGPLRRDLVPLYMRWRNDFWIQRSYGNESIPATLEYQMAWFERAAVTTESLWFTIYERSTERPIGLTDLFEIERDQGVTWFGMMIGEADARGKGYAAESARLMLDYAFTVIGMHVVALTVDEFNHAGRRAYENAGFRESGRITGATFVAGRRYDRILMQCVATEFNSPVLQRILDPETE